METDGKPRSEESVIEFRGDYIHVRGRGSSSAEMSFEILRKIIAACEEYDCYNILGESEAKVEMPTLEAFKHIDSVPKAGLTTKHRVAWVAEDPARYEQLKFIETVLRNRGLFNGQVFRTVAEAHQWLLGDGSAKETTTDSAAEST
ncbi:hypothetical protein LOC68_15585 [Blastopirellula sp. JC732]|uniref:Uncharacterized protein n=1 Tax=Blastopirellula sediminis TaxID=2894196 RepID=A0A9X1MN29_9BACT|nr:hypothetical protein [Blastopirellula sediminis]MCC9606893.1 hypothetical protein [Blastopirellula sediminis]MCC9629811.1 hypothetical protein [Blastopirellula sediminis]